MATDINIQLLQEITLTNFEAVWHDITVDGPPVSGFDFVHARWLLHHLPQPKPVLYPMIEALRPGGWLLLEEPTSSRFIPRPHSYT